MLTYISSWLTPTSLFVLLNLIIGTIFITSCLSKKPHQPHNEHQHQPLARVPSLLERVKSVNLSFYKFPTSETETLTAPVPLDHDHDFNDHHQETIIEPPTQVLQRAPSLLERVKSINFSSFYRSDKETEAISHEHKADVDDHHVKRSISEPRVAVAPAEKMKKSASEKAVDTNVEELLEEEKSEMMVKRKNKASTSLEKTVSFGEDGVDAKCDDFINRFKQQLKLQRLDSLLRYKEMLKGKQK